MRFVVYNCTKYRKISKHYIPNGGICFGSKVASSSAIIIVGLNTQFSLTVHKKPRKDCWKVRLLCLTCIVSTMCEHTHHMKIQPYKLRWCYCFYMTVNCQQVTVYKVQLQNVSKTISKQIRLEPRKRGKTLGANTRSQESKNWEHESSTRGKSSWITIYKMMWRKKKTTSINEEGQWII